MNFQKLKNILTIRVENKKKRKNRKFILIFSLITCDGKKTTRGPRRYTPFWLPIHIELRPGITLRANIYRSINFKSTASRVSTFPYVISNISELQIFRLKIVKMGTFLCRRLKFQKCGLRPFQCPLFKYSVVDVAFKIHLVFLKFP